MEKKKRGLNLTEIVLIGLVILVGLYSAVLLIYAGQDSIMLKQAFKLWLQVVTFGLVNYNSYPLTEIYFAIFIFFYITVIVSIIAFVLFLKNRYPRAIFGIINFVLGSATLNFGLCIYQGNVDDIMGRPHATLTNAAMCIVVLIVVLSYILGCITLATSFKNSVDHYNKVTGKVSESATVVKEVKEVVHEVTHEVIREIPIIKEGTTIREIIREVPVEVEKKEEEKVEEPVKVEEKVEEVKEEPVVEEPAVVEEVVEEQVEEKRKIERVPFADKLRKSDRDLKNKYDELKKYLLSYGLKNRISVDGDSYRLHRVLYVHITIAGKKMKVYFKLNPNDYLTSPIPVRDASDVKKYADVPVQLDVKSELSLKRAMALIDQVMEDAGFEKK